MPHDRIDEIEQHLQVMGLDQADVDRYCTAYELADETERERLWSLGDARILDEIRALRAADTAPVSSRVYDFPDGVHGLSLTDTGMGDLEIDYEKLAGQPGPMVDELIEGDIVIIDPDNPPDAEPLRELEEADVVDESEPTGPNPVDELDGLTVDEILAWVNNDPARAKMAMDFERMFEEPRVTLIARLQKLAEF